MDTQRLIAKRAHDVRASGIRRVFELASKLRDPITLSIGQPDFPVPEPIKRAAIDAIRTDRNGYTMSAGVPELRAGIGARLSEDLGWDEGVPKIVTSGTSGALLLAMMALLDPGDELIIPDPYFVMYPHLATMCGASAVRCDTYPDFRMTAERVEPLITPRTKAVLFNAPSNPAGVVPSQKECRELLELCRARGVLLISDEIYDEFTFADARTAADARGRPACPSPCREPGAAEDVLLIRGFGKTYGITGWRMGYAAGPAPVIEQIAKLQQFTFVCAPSIAQWGALAAFDVDMTPHIDAYAKRRDNVVERLGAYTRVERPGGAFYAFVEVPERLGLSGAGFLERCIEREVLVIPGGAFSDRDTHFRLSFACPPATLQRGLDALCELLAGE